METSDIISCISLFLSFCLGVHSVFVHWKLNKQQRLLNEQALASNKEKEEIKKKADLSAEVLKEGNSWRLKVYNKGKGVARNIRLDSTELDNDGSVFLDKKQEAYPLLNQGDSFKIFLTLIMGHKDSYIIKFIWDDEFGENRVKEQALCLTI